MQFEIYIPNFVKLKLDGKSGPLIQYDLCPITFTTNMISTYNFGCGRFINSYGVALTLGLSLERNLFRCF